MKIETKEKLVTLIDDNGATTKLTDITSLEITKTQWDIHVEYTCTVNTTNVAQFESVKDGKFDLNIQVVDGTTIDTHSLIGCSLHNMLDKSRTRFKIDFNVYEVDTDFEPDSLLIMNIEHQGDL